MKKLYRKRDSNLAGICSGLGQYFDVDETLIRILFLILVFTPFPILISYLMMWFVIPKEPEV
jgi:phage shock protein C